MEWAAQLETYVRYPLLVGEGANLVVPWHSHHAFQRPPCSIHNVFLHSNGEHILGEGAMHRGEVNHLHIGTMQAAPDTAVGGDKLAIRVTLLHLVDNAVLGRNYVGFGIGIFRNAAYHRCGGAHLIGDSDNVLAALRMRNDHGIWRELFHFLDTGTTQHIVRGTGTVVDHYVFVRHLFFHPITEI